MRGGSAAQSRSAAQSTTHQQPLCAHFAGNSETRKQAVPVSGQERALALDGGAPGKELAIRRNEGHRAAFRTAPPLHTTPRKAAMCPSPAPPPLSAESYGEGGVAWRGGVALAGGGPPLHTTPRTASEETPRIASDETVGRVRKPEARVAISGTFGKPLDASMVERRHLASNPRDDDHLEDQVSGRRFEYQVEKMACVSTRPSSSKIRDIVRPTFFWPGDLRACVPGLAWVQTVSHGIKQYPKGLGRRALCIARRQTRITR